MIGIPTKRTLWATSHVSGRTGMHRSCLIYAGTTIFMTTGEHSFNDLPNLASLLRSCFWKYKKYVLFLGLSDRVPQNWMVYVYSRKLASASWSLLALASIPGAAQGHHVIFHAKGGDPPSPPPPPPTTTTITTIIIRERKET